jgi:Na+-transporting NADH:ubiquinone oxidoreductase subunit NqrC|tara:strand:+ start:253 stop:633 length:381 start_codon:yes stop_codon:yes gene_type:complete
MQSTLILILVLVLGFGAVTTGGYLYYKNTQSIISQLEENNIILQISAEDNKKAIDDMQEDFLKTKVLSAELEVELQRSEERKDELADMLQRHNLTRLTLKKPGLIENRINAGTKKTFDDIESITDR